MMGHTSRSYRVNRFFSMRYSSRSSGPSNMGRWSTKSMSVALRGAQCSIIASVVIRELHGLPDPGHGEL
ncbi:MAG: hypothetical protein BWX71_02238 [Deltaproteobacteria bacterium ADurb.Bin072]|nr:MAG: hypothetical protein BWX71_02238 [Deltaproteobacteria bacterium ADurb.Bin072]